MSIFMWYILGAVLSGFIFTILQYADSFYNLLCNNIDDAKKELKNKGLSDTERVLLDGIDNDTIINYMSWTMILLSWAGLFLIVIYVLLWTINSDENKNKK